MQNTDELLRAILASNAQLAEQLRQTQAEVSALRRLFDPAAERPATKRQRQIAALKAQLVQRGK